VPGTEFQVNTMTAGCQMLPAVAADFNGNFIVVWQSDQDPGGGSGVYARRYTSAGTALDAAEFRVNTTAAGNQTRPSVAVAPDGRFLVAWQSDQQTGGQGWDVAAQAYNASGSIAGSEVLVNSVTAGGQTLPRAAYLNNPTEGFAVAWQSAGAVFVRRVAMSGAAVDASDRQVNTTATGFHRSPAVASDPSGNYAVVWESWDADGVTSRILARRSGSDDRCDGRVHAAAKSGGGERHAGQLAGELGQRGRGHEWGGAGGPAARQPAAPDGSENRSEQRDHGRRPILARSGVHAGIALPGGLAELDTGSGWSGDRGGGRGSWPAATSTPSSRAGCSTPAMPPDPWAGRR
jgi:hypothetical protein